MTDRQQNPDVLASKTRRPRWYIKPYVNVAGEGGELVRRQKRFWIGFVDRMTREEAETRAAELLRRLNRTVIEPAEPTIAEFVQEYVTNHVDMHLSASTRRTYKSVIKNHILPAVGHIRLGELSTHAIETVLNRKAQEGLSWAARADIRKTIGGIYTKAYRWGVWKGANPAKHVELGRRRAVRERRKLTLEQLRSLLAELREDVRLIVLLCLFSTLRISEVLGLKWKHVDLAAGMVHVRERWYRGDLDQVKTERGNRSVPLGMIAGLLRARWPGPGRQDDFVFTIKTTRGELRDDRGLRRYFLKPAARRLGLDYPGFGFHSFRREAITAIAAESDALQAMILAGHADPRITGHYGLLDSPRAIAAVEAMQRRLLGDPDKGE